ncbi:MAG: hypothetical protein Q8R82_00015 [Hyphomonadaceae bacterium]|nr:hypothetical protein [Hyphomonadaceae bacterium]
MTRHKYAQTGLVIPPLPQLLLTAVLRVFAMLVSNVVSTFQMSFRRLSVIGTRMMPNALPRMTNDTLKEQQAAQHRSPIALILSSTRSVRRVYPERLAEKGVSGSGAL